MAEYNKLHSINTSRILRAIWLNPGLSRIKLAEMLDLDRSTVTKIMQSILERGIVETAGKSTVQSGVGRRQINLRINAEIGVVLGVEIRIPGIGLLLQPFTGQCSIHSMVKFKTTADTIASHAVSLITRPRRILTSRACSCSESGSESPVLLIHTPG